MCCDFSKKERERERKRERESKSVRETERESVEGCLFVMDMVQTGLAYKHGGDR